MNNIASERQKLGISQAQLAKTLNWGRSRLSNYEANLRDQKGACDQLRRWTYAKGKQWKGLVTRREIEREVCLWEQR